LPNIVVGVDPGTLSWDFFGLEGEKIILDASITSKEILEEPKKALMILKSIKNIDLMVAPSGFGLPLKRVSELSETDIFYTLLKFKINKEDSLIGLGEVLRMIKAENIPAVIVPSVKHLPTVPRYRKINKIDMGTADKLCTSVVGIRDQCERFNKSPKEVNFIMVEIGHGFTAVIAVENGQIIDGIGGSNIMGFKACGSLDGELAYLIKNIEKKNIYRGGVSSIAGFSDLSLNEITLLAEKDHQTKLALEAYLSNVKKAVYSICASFSKKEKIQEILLAGRGARIAYMKREITRELSDLAPVRMMATYSQIAKRAAQGAAFIAEGLLGGKYKSIIDNMELKKASGTVLDDLYIPFNKDKILSDLH